MGELGVLRVSWSDVDARVGLTNTVGDQFHRITGIALGRRLVLIEDRVITDMEVPTEGLAEG